MCAEQPRGGLSSQPEAASHLVGAGTGPATVSSGGWTMSARTVPLIRDFDNLVWIVTTPITTLLQTTKSDRLHINTVSDSNIYT